MINIEFYTEEIDEEDEYGFGANKPNNYVIATLKLKNRRFTLDRSYLSDKNPFNHADHKSDIKKFISHWTDLTLDSGQELHINQEVVDFLNGSNEQYTVDK